jgi:hypothetical protein
LQPLPGDEGGGVLVVLGLDCNTKYFKRLSPLGSSSVALNFLWKLLQLAFIEAICKISWMLNRFCQRKWPYKFRSLCCIPVDGTHAKCSPISAAGDSAVKPTQYSVRTKSNNSLSDFAHL